MPDTFDQTNLDGFATRSLPVQPDALAPDGSAVRILVATRRGSMAHFELKPGQTAVAVAHHTVEELWFIVSGEGEMWRRLGAQEEITKLQAGVSLSLPVGTHFQFRCTGPLPLCAIGVTMPPWPGPDEAYPVAGYWTSADGG